MALYSQKLYWDTRYRSSPNDSHDWYQSYKNLRHLLNPIHFAAQGNGVRTWNRARASSNNSNNSNNSNSNNNSNNVSSAFPLRDGCRVLILGCGNSSFGEDMRKDGWNGPMMNLDFSRVVIDQMKERYGSKDDNNDNNNNNNNNISDAPRMEFICHDVTKGLPFEDESFDLIFCKGLFDAVLCSDGSVGNIRKLVEESVRCLVRGHGVFFVVTHGNPDNRLVFLEHENDINFHWDGVSVHTVERPLMGMMDYVYICRRRLDPLPLPIRNPPALASSATIPAAAMRARVKPVPVDSKENRTNTMTSQAIDSTK